MDEYIELEEAIKMMRGSAIAKYPLSFSIGILAAADELQKMPAADVAQVVHGRWVSDKDDILFHCSVCETQVSTDWDYDDLSWNYCPNCGARMDLEEQNEAKESRQP